MFSCFGGGAKSGFPPPEPEVSRPVDADVVYTVTTRTSDIKGASTDADVFIEFRGRKGSSGPHKLESAGDNFSRGKVDVFTVRGQDVGKLDSVSVWHNNKGNGPDWHLEEVR